MEREKIHGNTPLFSNSNAKEESTRKPFTGGGDRMKRDEWSDGAVESLLEAYESKWVLRNRAKLKGQDWEDVARHVSSRSNCTKYPKTQTQCKNKIESMKKRYRSESATVDASSWPLFSRLDHLLRASGGPPPPPPPHSVQLTSPSPLLPRPDNNIPPSVLSEPSPTPTPPQPAPAAAPPAAPPVETAENSLDSDDVDRKDKKDGGADKLSEQPLDKDPMATDSSTPDLFSEKDGIKLKTRLKSRAERRKKRRRKEMGIAESIRWLAEALVRSEQVRMDTMRELERMRIEAETKRGELDLKRTEITANTQLEIARLFAGSAKGVDSSLRIGRS
ncbi:hypothetical protein Nepgr_021132 [Nepenthes gracilis]|uniref:Myb/SANT-like DNA-binding domain-containing protein n=1 Tax=Nepenthes gracilis TaxID=150966 RepID=A0AAD3XX22_NEPGR|nr:hypothetical protein Nepgr_021132 [Nepenthes gracilis]